MFERQGCQVFAADRMEEGGVAVVGRRVGQI